VREIGVLLIACCACSAPRTVAGGNVNERDPVPARASERAGPVLPLPPPTALDPARVALGASLFESPLLSGDERVSCATCHHEQQGWADGAAHSSAPGRPATALNVPSLANLQYYFHFSWNGAYDDLAAHADALLENPEIMGSSWSRVAARLARAPGWTGRFDGAFADGLTPDNVRAALVTYEQSLSMPDAPFDRWLQGDAGAISADAQLGYRLFESRGCVSCHQGVLLGGNLFQRLGVMREYYPPERALARGHAAADLGRFLVTGREEDRFVFRVPSLRNVALTAPYLHDGSAPSLSAAVAVMADYQLGKLLSPEETQRIVQFLETLTGHGARQP
jgi:cytochrome c peroxidase